MSYRTGNTPTPDGTWTGPTPVSTSGGALAGSSRYVQYAAQLTTSDTTQTPVLKDVTVNYVVCVAPQITTQPLNQAVTVGQTASFGAAASGIPSPTVQWQVSIDSGGTWSDVSGATATTLAFVAQFSDNGKQYHAVFANVAGTATSDPATLTVNRPPTCPDSTAGVIENQTLVLAIAKLLRRASDPDTGDTLSITAAGPTSTNGPANNVVLNSGDGTITYTPRTGYVGSDSFTYTISDNHGATFSPTVQVTVTSAGVPSPNIVIPPAILPNGHFHVGFAGIPGYTYTIQYSPNPSGGSWTTIATRTAGSNGLFEFEDPTEPTPSSRFYRTIYP